MYETSSDSELAEDIMLMATMNRERKVALLTLAEIANTLTIHGVTMIVNIGH